MPDPVGPDQTQPQVGPDRPLDPPGGPEIPQTGFPESASPES
jgi:hypothetical protein